MAEGDGTIRNQFKAGVMTGGYHLGASGDTLVVSLVSDATISIDGSVGIAALTKHNGANYVDKTLASQAVTQDDTGDKGMLDAADVTWTALGAPSAATTWAVLWDDSVAGDPVIAKWVITTQSNGGNYTLSWHASNGLINIT
jgi:hypothetical protein